jgi:hypothetical protein
MNQQRDSASKASITLSKNDLLQIEQILAGNIAGLASELRLTDAADFVTFIRIGQMANLRNIVQSSAELHFEAETLELTELGEAESTWTAPPAITLPMKFSHGGISVYFKLRLAARCAAIEVLSVKADFNIEAPEELNRLVHRALQQALKSKPEPRQQAHPTEVQTEADPA